MLKKKPGKKKPSKANGGAMGKSKPQVGGGSASKKKMPMKQGQGGGKPGTPKSKMPKNPKKQSQRTGAGPSPLEKITGTNMRTAKEGAGILAKRAGDAIGGAFNKVKSEVGKDVDAGKKLVEGARDMLGPIGNPDKYKGK